MTTDYEWLCITVDKNQADSATNTRGEKSRERGSQPSEDFFTHQHNLDRSVIFHYRSMYLVLCMPVNETKHLPKAAQGSSFLAQLAQRHTKSTMSTLERGSNKNAGDIKILLMVFFYRLGVTFPMQRQSASDIPSQPTTTKTDTGMLKRCQ